MSSRKQVKALLRAIDTLDINEEETCDDISVLLELDEIQEEHHHIAEKYVEKDKRITLERKKQREGKEVRLTVV